MLPEQQQRIMGYFIEEAKDHLNTIEQGLLNLQATIEDPEMANELFRAAHSVKGGAAMLGIESMQRTSHRMEDYFKVLKESPVQVDRTLESMFLRVFDALQELLEQLQGPFGLTDDKAEEIMAGVEPVFEQLHDHLNGLVGTADTPEPVAAQQKTVVKAAARGNVSSGVGEDSALQLAFKSDVSACLREMLSLFKQDDNAQSRQALQAVCHRLAQFGDQFELGAWSDLAKTTQLVAGNSDNDYRTLAPVLIKDIKRAQDLVLAGRAPEIVVSEAMQVLLPSDIEADVDLSVNDEADGFMEDLLTDGASSDAGQSEGFDDLFGGDSSGEVSGDAGALGNVELGLESGAGLDFDMSDGLDSADFDGLLETESGVAALDIVGETDSADAGEVSLDDLLSTGAEPMGPEVGAAELNSLADLFEGDLGDLDDTWQDENISVETSVEASEMLDVDISSDFADLLEDNPVTDELTSSFESGDELADLFGEVVPSTSDEEAARSESEGDLGGLDDLDLGLGGLDDSLESDVESDMGLGFLDLDDNPEVLSSPDSSLDLDLGEELGVDSGTDAVDIASGTSLDELDSELSTDFEAGLDLDLLGVEDGVDDLTGLDALTSPEDEIVGGDDAAGLDLDFEVDLGGESAGLDQDSDLIVEDGDLDLALNTDLGLEDNALDFEAGFEGEPAGLELDLGNDVGLDVDLEADLNSTSNVEAVAAATGLVEEGFELDGLEFEEGLELEKTDSLLDVFDESSLSDDKDLGLEEASPSLDADLDLGDDLGMALEESSGLLGEMSEPLELESFDIADQGSEQTDSSLAASDIGLDLEELDLNGSPDADTGLNLGEFDLDLESGDDSEMSSDLLEGLDAFDTDGELGDAADLDAAFTTDALSDRVVEDGEDSPSLESVIDGDGALDDDLMDDLGSLEEAPLIEESELNAELSVDLLDSELDGLDVGSLELSSDGEAAVELDIPIDEDTVEDSILLEEASTTESISEAEPWDTDASDLDGVLSGASSSSEESFGQDEVEDFFGTAETNGEVSEDSSGEGNVDEIDVFFDSNVLETAASKMTAASIEPIESSLDVMSETALSEPALSGLDVPGLDSPQADVDIDDSGTDALEDVLSEDLWGDEGSVETAEASESSNSLEDIPLDDLGLDESVSSLENSDPDALNEVMVASDGELSDSLDAGLGDDAALFNEDLDLAEIGFDAEPDLSIGDMSAEDAETGMSDMFAELDDDVLSDLSSVSEMEDANVSVSDLEAEPALAFQDSLELNAGLDDLSFVDESEVASAALDDMDIDGGALDADLNGLFDTDESGEATDLSLDDSGDVLLDADGMSLETPMADASLEMDLGESLLGSLDGVEPGGSDSGLEDEDGLLDFGVAEAELGEADALTDDDLLGALDLPDAASEAVTFGDETLDFGDETLDFGDGFDLDASDLGASDLEDNSLALSGQSEGDAPDGDGDLDLDLETLGSDSVFGVDAELGDLSGLGDLSEEDALGDISMSPEEPSLLAVEGDVGDSLSEQAPFDFDDLEALIGEDPDPSTISSVEAPSADDEFSDLEALLADDAPGVEPSTLGEDADASGVDEFDDLEKLLEEADQTLGGPTGASTKRRTMPSGNRLGGGRRTGGGLSDQTMRVSVSHLDNLSNLVGELVVNRNTLEQDQERLRQFLDNLLFQVQQLNDVGQRMRDLYERSLLESSLISSRQSYQLSSVMDSTAVSSTNHATGETFDALEMDRFTGFHTLSQEMIELIVRVRESSSDIAYTVESSDQVTRQFRQVTTQLQEGLNKARMVPFGQTADRLPRAVRDISLKCGKEARLVVEGRDTLIDKMILEQLYDPMTHLVNNAITHGIETPDVREAAGKQGEGAITVRAFYQGNQTVIYVADDGGGIDPELVKKKAVQKKLISAAEAKSMSVLDVYELLFHPGFSTRDQADDFAGRGVGMDVVRTSLSEIRGSVTIDSELGKGTSFTIRLPLTLSISKALSCVSNQARIAFPMDGVEDMFDVPRERIQQNEQGEQCILWRDTLLPFQQLSDLLKFNRTLGRGRVYGGHQDDDVISIVVLRNASTYIALEVDQVIGEQEIVIKQLEGPVPKPVGIAGATVLGDGRVMPIADVLELIDLAMGRVRRDPATALWSQVQEDVPAETSALKSEPTVLIVDDSITVRELLSMSFNKVGYRVEQARDGQEAWEKLRSGLPCDLVFCDIEMPRMDGLELLSRMQKDNALKRIPIAMLTSRGADRHRQMAVDLGASGYFTKPYLEEALLDAAQKMLSGASLV